MKRKAWWKNRAIYSKLLASITLCITLTLLVSTFVYYSYYIRIEKNQVFRTNVHNLTQTSKEVADMTETAESLSFQIYRNSTISKLLYYGKPGIYDLTAAMSELSNYVNSMPYIESIYVFNPDSGVMYVSASRGENGLIDKNELADKDILHMLQNYQEYKPFTPIPRTYTISVASEEQRISAYTYLCYDAIGWNSAINSAVIVNLSASWINKDMDVGTSAKSGTSFILDDRNRLLSGATLATAQLGTPDRNLIDNRIRGRQAGSFVTDVDGHSSLVTFTSPDNLNWQYIRVIPYKNVTAQIVTMRNATLVIAGIIFLIGLVVSWVLSHRLYTPIGQIVSRINALETDKRDVSYTVRQDALRNLLLGITQPRTKASLEKLQRLGIAFRFHEAYRLVLFRIDEFQTLRNSRGGDLLPYKFAIMNIASEVAGSKSYQSETVDMGDDSIILLLNIPEEGVRDETELLYAMLSQIREACREYLKLGITASYSPSSQQPEQLHSLYMNVREASHHRFFAGRESIIDASSIKTQATDTYHYPAEKEKRLTDALLSGKSEEAKLLFSDIVLGTEPYESHVLRLTLSRLAVTVKAVMDNIQKRNGLPADNSLSPPSPDPFETRHQLEESYFRLFDDIQARLAEKRGSKQDDLIRRINTIISESYADPNLSLNHIADLLDMSPVYLSRLYKLQTMRAIVDVIHECRMSKACDLLSHTDDSVAAIAENTGFTSTSYFHRMFKRTHGVTPADYRRSKAQ